MKALGQDLLDAAGEGNAEAVREGLETYSQAEKEAWLKDAVLRATYEGRHTGVSTLLEVGAPATVLDGLGQTPLHWAARQGFEPIVRALIKGKADVFALNQDKISPLHLAAQFNHGSVVQFLLKKEADPFCVSLDKRTPLHLAAEHGSAVSAAVILEALKPQVDAEGEAPSKPSELPKLMEMETERGETALMRAASRGHGAVVQLLLQAGADNDHRNFFGQGALHLATYMGHLGASASLLDSKVKPNAAAQDGGTPLHAAVDRGHAQVVELLIAHWADLRITASRGYTALHLASEKGYADAVEALIASSANAEAKTDDARTSLALAAMRGHEAIVSKLLEALADVAAMDNTRQTPLHEAAAAGRPECCALLHKMRARLEQFDGSGRTPMQLALASQQDASVRKLMKLGAVLPGDMAMKPEMQPLIKEIEHEMLQEQLRAVEAGAGKKELKAAELKFEEARQELVKYTALGATAIITPVMHNAEIALKDAQMLSWTSKSTTAEMQQEYDTMCKQIANTEKETRDNAQDASLTRREMDMIREQTQKRRQEIDSVKKQIATTQDRFRDEQKTQAGASTETTLASKSIEDLKVVLSQLQETGEGLENELADLHGQIDSWILQKEQIHELHAQAEQLLNKPGKVHGYPGSPERSAPTSPKEDKEQEGKSAPPEDS